MLAFVRRIDGDLALLLFLCAVGLIPIAADLAHHRKLAAEATLGLLLASVCFAAALKRAAVLWRARALQRQLLAGERWTR